jgi:hypothetical protein
LEKKRAQRRYNNALIKQQILQRSYNQDIVNEGKYATEYFRNMGRLHFFKEYTEEKIYKRTRIALRCDGKRNPNQYGCSRYCMYCNPHLFNHIKINKVKNTLDNFDNIDFWEVITGVYEQHE